MQIETKMQYLYTPYTLNRKIKMKNANNTNVGEDIEKLEYMYSW